MWSESLRLKISTVDKKGEVETMLMTLITLRYLTPFNGEN